MNDVRGPKAERFLVERYIVQEMPVPLELPLESLGTGIHEIIIRAAAATVRSEETVCIEEPEIHLHLLQRKLVDYLEKETTNQYFLATHSAQLLNHPIGRVFHVGLVEGRCWARRCCSSGRDKNTASG